jgi:hypothetical protein
VDAAKIQLPQAVERRLWRAFERDAENAEQEPFERYLPSALDPRPAQALENVHVADARPMRTQFAHLISALQRQEFAFELAVILSVSGAFSE